MTFCEILHHVRKSFTLEQLATVVSYMACCVADRSLPFQSQSTCVRLSLNLVECLYQVGTPAPLAGSSAECVGGISTPDVSKDQQQAKLCCCVAQYRLVSVPLPCFDGLRSMIWFVCLVPVPLGKRQAIQPACRVQQEVCNVSAVCSVVMPGMSY